MVRAEITDDQALFVALGKSVMQQLRQNPYIFGLASVSSNASEWMNTIDRHINLHHLEGFSLAMTKVSSPVS